MAAAARLSCGTGFSDSGRVVPFSDPADGSSRFECSRPDVRGGIDVSRCLTRLAGVAEWQTRWTQNPVLAIGCRFKSDLRYFDQQTTCRASLQVVFLCARLTASATLSFHWGWKALCFEAAADDPAAVTASSFRRLELVARLRPAGDNTSASSVSDCPGNPSPFSICRTCRLAALFVVRLDVLLVRQGDHLDALPTLADCAGAWAMLSRCGHGRAALQGPDCHRPERPRLEGHDARCCGESSRTRICLPSTWQPRHPKAAT